MAITSKGAVALVSGGLDSVAALYMSARRPAPRASRQAGRYAPVMVLTVDYGQPAAARERAAARFYANALGLEHVVLRLPWMQPLLPAALDGRDASDAAVWVPNRNGLFINAAAVIAETRRLRCVVTGFNREEAAAFPDNSLAYIKAANDALRFSTRRRVRLVSPTARLDKRGIARRLAAMRADTRRLWACYGGGPRHCGRCPSCCRLFAALAAAGIPQNRWPARQG